MGSRGPVGKLTEQSVLAVHKGVDSVHTPGEPWFVASDVCKVLGFSNGPKAVRDHVLPGQQGGVEMAHPSSNSGFVNATVINEPGLYRLIMRSKVEGADTIRTLTEIKSLQVNDHPDELRDNGLRVVRGPDLRKLKSELPKATLSQASSVALWDRRAVLNLGRFWPK